ncbi:MAG TPA: molybdopterin cofactor-binding domain-containing protein [Geminicoccus sp.]|uniref:xanthine dehydrogenase family protein molybdopterin-binding subunit n=1 Tax=Geminicoccus sp. TaxID=2024832 RepID=UPI002C4BA98F|nr:molybdopterin cofactor-binding domain-containing protein [Geminicoccus sp.]HWL71961.1 molybdopterin cofactor-binding domain-containing protein [Geminicoccus sp.]
MNGHPRLSRRAFVVTGTAAAGALTIGVPLDAGAASSTTPDFAPNAFLRIARDGAVTLIVPYVEMGQGTYTSVPMLIAEELEIGLDAVTVEHAPADNALYANPIMGHQETDGSLSMRAAWEPMRRAGATARQMLIAAAASVWGVDAAACQARDGAVLHAASGRRIGYGDLVEHAATLPVPRDVPLKGEGFRLIGTPHRRLDAAAKVRGTARFGIDVQLPGMKVAAVMASPVLGGRLVSVDDTEARAVAGVRGVLRIDDAVAVVADHWAAAKKGLDALVVAWGDGPNATFSTKALFADLEAAAAGDAVPGPSAGDVMSGFARAARTVEASYRLPMVAHAPMEPLNCTVHLHDGRCEVWVGTQAATRAQAAAARAAGLPVDKVVVHNQYLGGSFGRRAESDNVTQAVLFARQVDHPLKIVWSREEDTQHDFYRPAYLNLLKAGLDASGRVTSWSHRVVGPSPLTRWLPAAIGSDGLDPDAVTSAVGPYAFENLHVDYVRRESPAYRSGFWRGVGTTHNAFVVESFMDELAATAGIDPLAFRRMHLADDPRLRAALDLAAERSGWGTPLPEGEAGERTGRGISLLQDFGGTILVLVAEVVVDRQGFTRVTKVTSVIDCGKVINPDTVAAQIQGGAIFGISAALYGEITFADGRVEQGNFDSYQAVRMDEAPRITVHVIESGTEPFGVGEAGTSGIGPAVANAVFAATGTRLRHLPITPEALGG